MMLEEKEDRENIQTPHCFLWLRVRKSFGGVEALKEVDFTVGRNEIVGLVGDNAPGNHLNQAYHRGSPSDRWRYLL